MSRRHNKNAKKLLFNKILLIYRGKKLDNIASNKFFEFAKLK